MSKVTKDEINAFLAQAFASKKDQLPDILELSRGEVTLKLKITEQHMRPGNFISGPTQMQLADHTAYVTIFTRLGLLPMAVTSNLNIDFMRPCIGKFALAKGQLLKIGRTLAVINVDIYGEGSTKLSSRASVTYALPQRS